MGSLALTSLLIGAAIGLRFRVFALFPVMLLGLPMLTTWGLMHGYDGLSILLLNLVGAVCLQFGYLAGTLPRFLLIAVRISRAETSQSVRPLAQ